MGERLKVLVLAGGPDREREVSLVSGAAVAAALGEAGHEVRQSDVGPGDLSALDAFVQWDGDVIFPVLHGRWGEGGGLQRVLDERALPYVGCRAEAAALCMDKGATKQVLVEQGLPTPTGAVVERGALTTLQGVEAPCVVKAVDEGSSFGMAICQTADEATAAVGRLLGEYERVVVEQYVKGMEVTVGVIDAAEGEGVEGLPAIQIVPAGAFYDFQAKYESDATQYRFDVALPGEVMAEIQRLALQAYEVLGVRHMGRVDFLVDEQGRPWILEVNTIPGFTSHSLLPMAAAKAGLAMPALVDRLARLGQG
ncbi:D-alanine--D-alanine ligase [Phycisphaerales bacterium AB-hyl4]|uniref:D-alanine--D-alanine ligase n=1 Tax=Natronomicrosphaera hydrolytica TaxID=3242702 RepID=A0ABV4U0Z9_9BACT